MPLIKFGYKVIVVCSQAGKLLNRKTPIKVIAEDTFEYNRMNMEYQRLKKQSLYMMHIPQ